MSTVSLKDPSKDQIINAIIDTSEFVLPKNLINLIGKEVLQELNFDEDTTFDVSKTFTSDFAKLLVTFTATIRNKPFVVIFYFSKKENSAWWYLEEKFRVKSFKAEKIIETLEIGGEIKLDIKDGEEVIVLEILGNGEVLFWKSEE